MQAMNHSHPCLYFVQLFLLVTVVVWCQFQLWTIRS